jgi:endonuclease/exonuclease/phosphatase family metal-dependent hydrolase
MPDLFRRDRRSRFLRFSRSVSVLAVLASGAFMAACETNAPTHVEFPGDPLFKSAQGEGRGQFASVMTRNLYIGTDISTVLQAAPEQVPLFVAAGYREVVASRPAERMAAIADEIATHQPDLVGLQEVSAFYTQTPGDFLVGNPQRATDLQYDFLSLLLDALHVRGMNYRVAAVTLNVDLELPAYDPATGVPFDVRLLDRGVILVRDGISYWNSSNGLFSAYLPISLGAVNFSFTRGWTAVDAKVRGREFRFVNTHLETQDARPVNEAQGLELLSLLGGSPLPTILVGDLNSAANPSAPEDRKTATYGRVLDAGFKDLWTDANPVDSGLTCCHAPDLLNTTVDFEQRIDFIFYGATFRGSGGATIVGRELADRTGSGRWPSDHAGLVGEVRLP